MSLKLSKEERLVALLKEKGSLLLKARYGKTQGPLILCPVADPVTGEMLGVKVLSEEEQRKEKRIVTQDTTRKLTDDIVIKYENIVDRIDWHWIVFNKEIAENRKEAWKDETSLFFIDSVEQELEEKISLKERILEAQLALKSLSQDRRVKVLRLLGVDASYMNPNEVAEFLYEKAEKFPEKIMEKIGDKEADQKIFALNMIDKKIIVKDSETGVFLYGSTKLGTKMDSVVAWLKDPSNNDIIREMQKDILPIK